MNKISEILRLRYELHLSYRDIADSQNVGFSTVGDYLRRAKAVGLSWPLPEGINEQELYERLFLPSKQPKRNRPTPDWEQVCREHRKKGVTLQLLWREYRDIHPEGLGYTQYCKHYRDYIKQTSPVMRQLHKAGDKVFVDYAGMTVPWLDTSTGEVCEAQVFVGCLGASQFTFAEATATQQLPDWIGSHIRMWEYFGGVSQVVVPDNLKSGVTKAHRYDPDINANYQHVGEHYGFAIVPARPATPRDKGKVENAVGCIERQVLAPLRHRTFTSISEINHAIKERLSVFNNQLFQKMKTSRRQLFEEVDKPALKPLPKYCYEYATWKKARVNIDYHIAYDDHYYSVPYKYIHQEIAIRATAKTVECFYQNQRIAVHQRSQQRYKFTTLKAHMPKAHKEQGKWTPERIKRWAKKIGPSTKEFIQHMIDSRAFPEQAFRSCLGLLRLGKRYGEERLEKACTIALKSGAYRYQHVETILKKKMDNVAPANSNKTPKITAHQNIRGPHYYQ